MSLDFTDFEDSLYDKFSRSTINETMRKMRNFDGRMNFESRDDIMSFLREERRNGKSAETLNDSYIKYLNRWMIYNGWDKIRYLPQRKKSYKVKRYDSNEIKKIIEGSSGPSIEDKRDHAMVMLALNTGLRRAERTNLKVSDLHERFLRVVKGKGEKDRDVYLDPGTAQVLSAYLKVRNHPELEYVFTTKKGKITPSYMGNLAGRITERTGVRFNRHKCRHTYAKNMVSNDVDLQTLSQMLGHESLATTQIYTVLDTTEAKERVQKKNLKFYKEGKMFKSHQPYTEHNGPAGI